jgi:hypothetical protein
MGGFDEYSNQADSSLVIIIMRVAAASYLQGMNKGTWTIASNWMGLVDWCRVEWRHIMNKQHNNLLIGKYVKISFGAYRITLNIWVVAQPSRSTFSTCFYLYTHIILMGWGVKRGRAGRQGFGRQQMQLIWNLFYLSRLNLGRSHQKSKKALA